MGSNLTLVSAFSAAVVGPDAGNGVTAASVRVMGTSLGNRTKYLKDLINESGGVHVFPFVTPANSAGPTWIWYNNTWTQGDVTTSPTDKLIAPIHLPNGSTITSVAVTVICGGHSAAPAVQPGFDLHKYGVGTSFTTIISGAGSVVTYPTYDSTRQLTSATISEVVNNQAFAYVVALTGESGLNAIDLGLAVISVAVHFTPAA